jgi:hypothetical protein
LRSTEATGPNDEPIFFTGSDILWFNGTSAEIRFKDNITQRNKINAVSYKTIKSYLGDDYLFSSLICASEVSSQIYNSLVLFYSQTENRFYLKDGYPDISIGSGWDDLTAIKIQEERDKNKKAIADEWNKFIQQLKKENRYTE